MAFALPLVVFMLALCTREIYSCQNGWESYDGHCYFMGDTKVTWAVASAICKSYNAHLAMIPNAHVDNFLRQLATRFSYGHKEMIHFWLDGSDSVIEGDWIWTESGQRLAYTNWNPGEPSNSEGSIDDCLVLHSQMSFRWDDIPCLYKARFICEAGGHWTTFG
ncbi:perlucin-like [Pecten maximus]|uniref:perlucin-like n=1 Tax=Pecten maximus TaxID=6579 RepID=UPI0014588E75|nr:perlucin-like [Pecten maximus]